MRILVIVFGGLDHKFLRELDCKHLKQVEFGPVVVDGLWGKRDVATQITAQLITGQTWEKNGIPDRRKYEYKYALRWLEWLERTVLKGVKRGRQRRHKLYEVLNLCRTNERNYMRQDLLVPSLFDLIDNSRAVYVPAWNPEPSWALGRNILNPRQFPTFGVEGAIDLRDKNFHWRRKRLFDALDHGPYSLLMAQFQYIDSTQHLYLVYEDPERMDLVEEAYFEMDKFAGSIKERAEGVYDRIVFLSDNGAARKEEYRPTHYNRPFYSLSWQEGLESPNLRDFFSLLIKWVTCEPNEGGVRLHELQQPVRGK